MATILTQITRWVDRVKEPMYIVMVGTLYTIYILMYSKIIDVHYEIVMGIRASVTILICLFLMLKFNPLREHVQLKYFDSTIIFGSSIILLSNLVNSLLVKPPQEIVAAAPDAGNSI